MDNFVVDYDSDISLTLPKSSKIPGFNHLYDEEDEDMSVTNIHLNNPNDQSNASNNSELDMSVTRSYKIPNRKYLGGKGGHNYKRRVSCSSTWKNCYRTRKA